MLPLARALRRQGYRTLNLGYRSRHWPLGRILDRLTRRLDHSRSGAVHFVGHSMGGLVARAWLARSRPTRLGRVVLLGTPNGGSEYVGFLAWARVDWLILGHARGLLATDRPGSIAGMLGEVDYPLGVIAGDRPFVRLLSSFALPEPHDGKVSVAATHVAGETDHIVLPISHTSMPWNRDVQRQIIAFLGTGRFER